jgi:hypothetical protein
VIMAYLLLLLREERGGGIIAVAVGWRGVALLARDPAAYVAGRWRESRSVPSG